jgi:hypothetical protein
LIGLGRDSKGTAWAKSKKPLAKGILGESRKWTAESGYWVAPAVFTTAASVGCTTGFSAKKL